MSDDNINHAQAPRLARRTVIWRLSLLSLILVSILLLLPPSGENHLTIQANNDTIKVEFDGQLASELQDTRYLEGEVGVVINPASAQPRISSIGITKAKIVQGDLVQDLLPTMNCEERGDHFLECRFPGLWRDFKFELTCSGCDLLNVLIRRQADGSGYRFNARPWYHFDCFIAIDIAGENGAGGGSQCLGLRPSIYYSLVAIVSELIPSLGAGILLSLLGLLFYRDSSATKSEPHPFSHRLAVILICILPIIALAGIRYITFRYLGDIPHVQDSSVYYLQSKMLANGWAASPLPPTSEHFVFQFMFEHNNQWVTQYPFFWPLILALGQVVQMPALIPACVGALTIFTVFWCGWRLFGKWTGFWAAFLLLLSSWFQMTSANFMSHHIAALLTLLFVFGFVEMRISSSWKWGIMSGLALGALFSTRPLTAVSVGVGFALYGIAPLLRVPPQMRTWRPYFGALSGFTLMMLVFFIHNLLALGALFTHPYEVNPVVGSLSLAFFGWTEENFSISVAQVFAQLSLFRQVALPLPANYLAFLVLPALLFKPLKSTLPICIAIFSIIVGYTGIGIVGSIMYGPRYWYETLPLFALLSALGITSFLEAISFDSIFRRFLCLTAVVGLVGTSGYKCYIWLSDTPGIDWIEPFTPLRIARLENFNGIDPTLSQHISQLIKPSIIFIQGSEHWTNYGQGFFMNDPDFAHSKAWIALDLGEEKNKELIAKDPTRELYRADVTTGTLNAYYSKEEIRK